jgi:hypothetical protein
MILIVTGSRNISYIRARREIIDFLRGKPQACIYHGNSGNVDLAARDIGEMWSGYSQKPFDADWRKHGTAAGPIRNRAMVKHAVENGLTVMGLAIWDGKSRGTKNCITNMRKLGIEPTIITVEGQHVD